jgi:predicted O-linked N-acetylglucosamine transferase (SPINDLY family)
VLKDLGRLDEALRAYRAAHELDPADAQFHSNLLFLLHFHPGFNAGAIRAECRHWDEKHALPLRPTIRPHANLRDSERRLRVGYVSPFFRDHCQSFFTLPLLSHHDRRHFEIYCYANVHRPDPITKRVQSHADVWRDTVGLTDAALAEMVRGDRIDILIDLTMHMAYNRLLVFARKPAPVQVAWLAYPGTTGLSAIDYRLTDPYLDPPGQNDDDYAEQSIRLPDTFWCYDPLTDEPAVNDLPAARNGFVTFGCLNHFCKVNDGTLGLWARVLGAVPNSRLILLAPPGPAREHVLARLARDGIAGQRVEFVTRQGRQKYLAQYHRIDIALDPLPYNGHTTSLDAFWMGVPTVTLIGTTVAGRAGWSQLGNLDLKHLAAASPERFVQIATRLAQELSGLQNLRATLRQRISASPLMDAGRFARHVEQAYRQMWRRWCAP